MGDDEIGAITGVAFPYVVGNHRAVVDVLVVGVDFCLQLGYQSFAVALFCSGLVAHGKLGFGNEVGLLCLGLFYLLGTYCGLQVDPVVGMTLDSYHAWDTVMIDGVKKIIDVTWDDTTETSAYFLLDEPLSNLDAKLRQKARTELVKIHEMFKPTMVYVTHDQIEAMTVAHRIAVMNQGRIQQIDTPANIYHHPANTFVATFIGSPAMNILKADILDGKIIVGDCALKLPQERLQEIGGRSKVLFGLRPEACTPSFESAMINGKADFVENTGNLKTATLKLATGESFYLQDSDQALKMEGVKGFNFDWENVCLFDAESGENLAKVR